MTIDRAIEILGVVVTEQAEYDDPDGPNAVKLGIEALKFHQRYFPDADKMSYPWLPGETAE